MIRRFKNSVVFSAFVMLSTVCVAQDYHNQSAIDKVDKAGFYSIAITPSMSRLIKKDFSDIRIVDDNSNPVPYILQSKVAALKPNAFKQFPIIRNEVVDSGKSEVVVENESIEMISSVALHIKNTEVNRTIDVSGTNDLPHWFTIVENLNIGRNNPVGDDSYMENISLPVTHYRYLKFTIYNGKNDPLNIVGVGMYMTPTNSRPGNLILNPTLQHTRKDSANKISYITINNPDRFHIDHMMLKIRGPKFFKRPLDISSPGQLLGNFLIASDSISQFALPMCNDSVFFVRIYNEDNPPLNIDSIFTFQSEEKIIAYFEPGKNYHLQLTNSGASAPRYDLDNFKDKIPPDVPELKLAAFSPMAAPAIQKSKDIFTQVWIWPVMVTVLLVLILFTVRLVKDLRNKI